ncbi:MAG: NifB/NifX family molybdenum-iron cluster-binding protein [Rikenellaceae bacterium]
MRIAIPTKDGLVDNHFGHCAYYTIFTVEDNKIVSQATLPSPQGCGCKSNIATILREIGVRVMLAGSMGDGAKNVLKKQNIDVIRGCSGDVEELANAYLSGEIDDSGEACAAHGDGDEHHECHK